MKDQLTKLAERRHPKYEEGLSHWNLVEQSYEGGREWFRTNIFKYRKEGSEEYADRVRRAYRFNHCRQVVDVVNEYLFKTAPGRKVDDAPTGLAEFWACATRSGLSADEYAKSVSLATSLFGRVWIVVDSTMDSAVASVADEKKAQAQIYSYVVRPQQALDMSIDAKGELNWFLSHELHRDDSDPIESSGAVINRYRLWTRTHWFLYEEQHGPKGKVKIVEIGSREHNLGLVPVFAADNEYTEDLYTAPGVIDDVVYLDRAVANYLSNVDAIIQDQTFSQLVMPAQGLMPGEEAHSKLVEMGTKRLLVYNGESGASPAYISPDVKQAQLIMDVIAKVINEIYHSVGLSAERTKEDNGGGIDNASGVAKSYDFERVNGMLVAKADSLETFEARLTRLVLAWRGVVISNEDARTLVTYPRDFDVRGLYDEFEIGARLSLLMAPDALRREQMRTLIAKLMPTASDAKRAEMEASLENWPPPPSVLSDSSGALSAVSVQKTAKELAA